MTVLKLLRFHLTNLTNFAGREDRGAFWPYVACVFAFMMAGMTAIMVPMMMNTFAKMQQFAVAHPEQATIESGPGSYSITIQGSHPELMPDFGNIIGAVAAVCILVICLLAAAVVRRLHDRGKSGLWGLMPVPFLMAGFAIMPVAMRELDSDITLFFILFFNNLIYLVCLGALVLLLAGAGSLGENRYGPPPTGD